MSSSTGTATGGRDRRLVDCVLVALAYLAVVPDTSQPGVDRITEAGVDQVHGPTTERVFAHVPWLGYVVGAVSGRLGVALLAVLVVLLALFLLRPGSAWSVRRGHPRPPVAREVS